MGKSDTVVIQSGTINTEDIFNTHTKVKEIVESYKDIRLRVDEITLTVQENWVGQGATAFESQYKMLKNKIEDFGDTLQEIYENLVKAETDYEEQDDSLRQDFVRNTQA